MQDPLSGVQRSLWLLAAGAIATVLLALQLEERSIKTSDGALDAGSAAGPSIGSVSVHLPETTPLHHGKTLKQWVQDLSSTDAVAVQVAQQTLSKTAAQSHIALALLLECLRSSETHIRLNALGCVELLEDKNEALVPEIVLALSDPDAKVRAEAALVLGRFNLAALEAVPALKELAKNDPDEMVRSRAKDALFNVRIYNPPVMPVLEVSPRRR